MMRLLEALPSTGTRMRMRPPSQVTQLRKGASRAWRAGSAGSGPARPRQKAHGAFGSLVLEDPIRVPGTPAQRSCAAPSAPAVGLPDSIIAEAVRENIDVRSVSAWFSRFFVATRFGLGGKP